MTFVLGILPARMWSTRLPGKPSLPLNDIPLVVHVYRLACGAQSLSDIVVATDDTVIGDICDDYNIRYIMTRSDHPSGTDRCSEAFRIYEKLYDRKVDAVVNIQADMPFLKPESIDEIVSKHLHEKSDYTIGYTPFPDQDKTCLADNAVCKIAFNKGNPYIFRHTEDKYKMSNLGVLLGLYVFDTDFLDEWSTLEPGPMENQYMIEQFRAFENGKSVSFCKLRESHFSIDTKEEYWQYNSYLKMKPGEQQ